MEAETEGSIATTQSSRTSVPSTHWVAPVHAAPSHPSGGARESLYVNVVASPPLSYDAPDSLTLDPISPEGTCSTRPADCVISRSFTVIPGGKRPRVSLGRAFTAAPWSRLNCPPSPGPTASAASGGGPRPGGTPASPAASPSSPAPCASGGCPSPPAPRGREGRGDGDEGGVGSCDGIQVPSHTARRGGKGAWDPSGGGPRRKCTSWMGSGRESSSGELYQRVLFTRPPWEARGAHRRSSQQSNIPKHLAVLRGCRPTGCMRKLSMLIARARPSGRAETLQGGTPADGHTMRR
mmetsp:Transcript_50660/g.162143  ORF Transcript_50660/g.162143 Transcript_50660/m.162143 type:complete len:294 (-) Transcript_50660:145-1026(-)